MLDPFGTFNDVRLAFLRYLDSPFRLRYPALLEERRHLLDADRQLYREPLFEPIAPYESSGLSIHDAASRLGVDPEAAEFISRALFTANRKLYRHQLEAWRESRNGNAVVVTSATGSGKTECYLLPIMAELVEESKRGWGMPGPPPAQWWDARGATRVGQREHEGNQRPAALRALFLYPLNALIEDQLGRIRHACDSPRPREWFSEHQPGHRFWFGRYTGATPVPGDPANATKRSQLRNRLRTMGREWKRAVASAQASGDDRVLDYFQDPHGSEMWSRWDMQETPPDILITNYSMLNIMLMRHVEESIFDRTAQWLASDRERNRFHLVVDELHSYRGTPGTEVAYLLRALLERLGLTPASPQLRIIATSASIENDDRSLTYLEQFFGRDRGTFAVITGHQEHFSTGTASMPTASTLAEVDAIGADVVTRSAALFAEAAGIDMAPEPSRTLADGLARTGVLELVRSLAANGPFTARDLAHAAFNDTSGESLAAARTVLRSVVLAETSDGVAPLPTRTHYFFHNAGRLWACVNPDCPGRRGTTPEGADLPPVGRLFVEPRPRCPECRSAVLELLYCQPCGEVFLGGFHEEDPASQNAWFLAPDYPNFDQVPDRAASLRRRVGEYMLFWPAMNRRLVKTTSGQRWDWQEATLPGWSWTPATLDRVSPRIALAGRGAAGTGGGLTQGFVFRSPDPDANAFASKCPHCGADWVRRRIGSPIRDLGAGFQRVVQLLCDSMVRDLEPDTRKLVLFSDSRQDAAKLSTGTKLAHHRDTVRQLAFELLAHQGAESSVQYEQQLSTHDKAVELQSLEEQNLRGALDAAGMERRTALLRELAAETAGEVMRYVAAGGDRPSALVRPTPLSPYASMRFGDLLNVVRAELLTLGMNPGGPQPSCTKYRVRRRRARGPAETVWWYELFDWDAAPPVYRRDLQPVQQQLRDIIELELREAVVEDVFFADGSRDFESLNLGLLWIDESGPQNSEDEVCAGVVRMLAHRRRWVGSEAEGQIQRPAYVDRYLDSAASRVGVSADALAGSVARRLGGRLDQWMVDVSNMTVVVPRGERGVLRIYQCPRCGKSHLHASGRTCTACFSELPSEPALHDVTSEPRDYYEYLARTSQAAFRMHSEELTGQTNTDDRQIRQRRFQEVFMQDEQPLATGVDLLSVTTTMESGVDIGSLQAVALANMPPVRFNYQQRVGRAGRRGSGVAVALTLCRGRSHDDYYFERPHLITAEPPPTPYVDVTRREIALRVINKEVLRRAFRGVPFESGGDNVHGEFGTVAEWTEHRPRVAQWLQQYRRDLDAICTSTLRHTNFATPEQLGAVASDVHDGLLDRIDKAVEHVESLPHLALSERLASFGILPMFGFPTRVRLLYHQQPSLATGWPPERGVIDRQLDIAISQFAPGAQTVKDDELHTAVGVVDYRPEPPYVVAAADPLGETVEVGICRRCQALEPDSAATGGCPYCSASRAAGTYRTVHLSEPPGFTTWFSVKAEFTGGFEFTPRALRSRIGGPTRPPAIARNFTIDSGPTRVYRVNDNDGKDFEFRKLSGRDVWVTEEAFAQAMRDVPLRDRAGITTPAFDEGVDPLVRAFASISHTDVLTCGIADVPVGLTLNPAIPEARAAWYSFGFLLRRAAAVSLDVAESELELGMQPIMDFSSPFEPPSARVFISDTLENGAGYSTHLGDPDRFEGLLNFILGRAGNESFLRPLLEAEHADECATSCHRCLREYGNMAFHPLLDWRLALDMARLATDVTADIDLGYGYWEPLVEAVADAYFEGLGLTPDTLGPLRAGQDPNTGVVVVLTHPLWDTDRSNLSPMLARAIAEAEAAARRVELRSIFRAVRVQYV